MPTNICAMYAAQSNVDMQSLPNWLKEIAATCSEQERQQLEDAIRQHDMTKTQVEYNRASIARKRERGLVRIEVWVPEKDKQKLRDYAKQLQREAGGR